MLWLQRFPDLDEIRKNMSDVGISVTTQTQKLSAEKTKLWVT